jgi:hypothetical protein
MISDGSKEEMKESILQTLGWSESGLCLAVIREFEEAGIMVTGWVNSDDPHSVVSHVQLLVVTGDSTIEDKYVAAKTVLRNFELMFLDWEWVRESSGFNVVLSFASKHATWTKNDPPAGGIRIGSGWIYSPPTSSS